MDDRHGDALDAVIAGLMAERYAPSRWWHRDRERPAVADVDTLRAAYGDDDITTARRRRELLAAMRPTSTDDDRLAIADGMP